MTSRNISVHTAIACLLWPAGVLLVCVGLVTNLEIAPLGIVLAMIAATLTVRGYFCAFERREHNAFRLGQDYGEHVAEVRQLR